MLLGWRLGQEECSTTGNCMCKGPEAGGNTVQGADCPRSCSRSGGWRGASGQSKQSPCPPQQLHFPSALLLPLTLCVPCSSLPFPLLHKTLLFPPLQMSAPRSASALVRGTLTGPRTWSELPLPANPCAGEMPRQRSPVPVPRGQDPHMTTMSRMNCAGLRTQVRHSGSTGEALNTLKPPLCARYCSRY